MRPAILIRAPILAADDRLTGTVIVTGPTFLTEGKIEHGGFLKAERLCRTILYTESAAVAFVRKNFHAERPGYLLCNHIGIRRHDGVEQTDPGAILRRVFAFGYIGEFPVESGQESIEVPEILRRGAAGRTETRRDHRRVVFGRVEHVKGKDAGSLCEKFSS